MDRWKEKLCLEHTWYLYLCVFLLLAFISWQQSLIADLQERMMNVEASRYDDQLNNIEWAATLALEQNKEQQKDIYSLQKSSADYQSASWSWNGMCMTKDSMKRRLFRLPFYISTGSLFSVLYETAGHNCQNLRIRDTINDDCNYLSIMYYLL